jgi:hypothetical protein
MELVIGIDFSFIRIFSFHRLLFSRMEVLFIFMFRVFGKVRLFLGYVSREIGIL